MTSAAVLVVDEVTRRHLAAALAAHRRRLRLEGRPVPRGMAALCDMLRQEPTERGDPADSGDDVDMGLVLDAGEVAAALKVSQRTAERLIASGELPSVLIGRSRRVTGEDLKEFLVKLPRAIKEDA